MRAALTLSRDTLARFGRVAALILCGALVSACAQEPAVSTEINDPFESVNRQIHKGNVASDKYLINPASKAYVAVVPRPARTGISNVVSNLNEPIRFINHTLQGDIDAAGQTFARFGFNTVFGLGGLLDPATEAEVPVRRTDFGETLAVWGVPQGPYLELPFFGGSTVRDATGIVVDIVADPFGYTVEGELRTARLAATGVDLLGDRAEFAPTIDALLYESADSYAALRIAYLQRRAREIRGETTFDDLEDLYDFEE